MILKQLSDQVSVEFQKTYGRPPQWIVAAPGRVNVIGEHIDYNDGYVLPMAIEFYTVMAADRPLDGQNIITLRSTLTHEPVSIDLSEPIRPSSPKWGNYPRGVVAGFMELGIHPGGMDVLVHSTVPLGSGLSSSAALEVCTATLLEAVTGQTLDPVDKALLAQKAEHEFAGVPCGIMDQFVSALGHKDHLLLLDCRTRKTTLVPMNNPAVKLLIINTNVKHELGSGEYAKRRNECESAAKTIGVTSLRDASFDHLKRFIDAMSDTVYRRAFHVIGEINRTIEAAHRIQSENWIKVGELLYASHTSLRDNFEVSCRELDAVVDIARNIGLNGGVYGCRMTGGGFGGCAVALVKADQIDAITQKIETDYRNKTGLDATIFSSRPATGAAILSMPVLESF